MHMVDEQGSLSGVESAVMSEKQPLFSSENVGFCLKTLALTYEIDNRALIDDVSVEISDKNRTIIMGPNGAGKSLFLRLIHGLIQPNRGEVRWGGRMIDLDIRARLAMVFQRPVLLRRSVSANMDFALSLRGKTDPVMRDELLDRVSLLPHSDQPARLLSGGEQQRLALVRALALEPDVLLLDEPTANLDPASVLMIEEIVNEVHGLGTKIIFVTHDLAQARRLGDEIIFMHRGKILEQAPASIFFANPQSEAAQDFLAGRIVT